MKKGVCFMVSLSLIGIVCSVIGLIVTAVCFACSGCAICQMQAALNAIF